MAGKGQLVAKQEHNCFHGIVVGRVQGVGYRVFAREAAQRNGVTGWVRNLPNRTVEIHAEGDEMQLTEFLTELYCGPIMAHVSDIRLEWKHTAERKESFDILR